MFDRGGFAALPIDTVRVSPSAQTATPETLMLVMSGENVGSNLKGTS